jgi:hypothetical protein
MDTSTLLSQNSGWWLALALVNAGLAESKGRRRLLWFVLSLFLGPLASFLIVVWRRPGDYRTDGIVRDGAGNPLP